MEMTNVDANNKIDNSINLYVERIINRLSIDNPIELLDNMEDTSLIEIQKILENNDKVKFFSINIEGKKRLIIKKHEKTSFKGFNNETEIINLAKYYMQKHMWSESIMMRNKLICHHNNPYSYLYYHNGACYLRMNNIKEAIKYYEIASGVAKLEGADKYSELDDFICKLKYEESVQQKQPSINIDEGVFKKDLNDNYGIDIYNDIVALIEEKDLTLSEACSMFKLNDEKINMVKLMYARNYYSKCLFDSGDKLLKEVEKSSEKTPMIKSLMREIKTNKKYYQYRKK